MQYGALRPTSTGAGRHLHVRLDLREPRCSLGIDRRCRYVKYPLEIEPIAILRPQWHLHFTLTSNTTGGTYRSLPISEKVRSAICIFLHAYDHAALCLD